MGRKLDVDIQTLAFRPMKNKWASCSTNGNLSFNSELLQVEKDVGNYVIVHELLHYFVPNHGKLWKRLMSAHLGDYEFVEAKLKKYTQNKTRQRAATIRSRLSATGWLTKALDSDEWQGNH